MSAKIEPLYYLRRRVYGVKGIHWPEYLTRVNGRLTQSVDGTRVAFTRAAANHVDPLRRYKRVEIDRPLGGNYDTD